MDQINSLADLPIGMRAIVRSVEGEGTVFRRLMEMGIVPGTAVRVIKSAPFGDPIEVRVLGYNLALRRSEAAAVSVAEEQYGS